MCVNGKRTDMTVETRGTSQSEFAVGKLSAKVEPFEPEFSSLLVFSARPPTNAPAEGLAHWPTQTEILVPLEGSETLAQAVRALQWRERLSTAASTESRKSRRHHFAGTIIVVLELQTDSSVKRIAFPGQCRNISSGGLSLVTAKFLVPAEQQLMPGRPAAASLLFNIDRIIEPKMPCYVCLPGMQSHPLWLKGEIKRKRLIGSSLLEVGIAFTRRLS
jgi:hypothetical protein